ncbi:MAG: hypothetical protein AAB372_02080 [Patescibacteria group bacterium]
MKRILKFFVKSFIIIVFICVAVAGWLMRRAPVLEPRVYGVTFAPGVAEWFGLDARDTYRAILDDLRVRHIRIGAYWTEIERERGTQDFSMLDWQVSEAEARGAKLILALGRKVPRWPECHIPSWVRALPRSEQDEELYRYMRTVVERYKNSSAIEIWQVENEPYLPFGECPYDVSETLDQEVALVHSLDPSRPILTTDSGELSIWIRAAKRGDQFGTTMYRRVNNKYFGQFEYPLPPEFFRAKRAFTELVVGKKPMMVIELQGEPWLSKPVNSATVEEQYAVMDPEYFKDTLRYAEASGFDTFYLWGVEWWYWLKQNGHSEIWEIAKSKILVE